MPLITVTAGTPILPPGTYAATLIGIAPKRMATKFSKPGTEDDFLEWTWLVSGSDRDIEITSLTSVATGPKSRIFEYLVALLGADNVQVNAGFDENDLVGHAVQVSIVTTEDGFSKIDRVIAPQVAPKPRPAQPTKAAPVKAPVADDLDDDLPF